MQKRFIAYVQIRYAKRVSLDTLFVYFAHCNFARSNVQKIIEEKVEVKNVSARTPKRIAAAKKYRDAARHKDELTRKAVDRIVHHFVCPDA